MKTLSASLSNNHNDGSVMSRNEREATEQGAQRPATGMEILSMRMASTAQHSSAGSQPFQAKTLSGCEVKRLSVHGGCLGSQRR